MRAGPQARVGQAWAPQARRGQGAACQVPGISLKPLSAGRAGSSHGLSPQGPARPSPPTNSTARAGSRALTPPQGPCERRASPPAQGHWPHLRGQGQRSRKEASLRAQQPLSLAPLGALSARGLLDTALPDNERPLVEADLPPGRPSQQAVRNKGQAERRLGRVGRHEAGVSWSS